MPVQPIALQRGLREVGRIRLGQKNERGRPEKLYKFRLTSQDRAVIEAAAKQYGGQVRRWDAAPGDGDHWEVLTDARELEVIIPPGESGFSQYLELWSAGGCQRRCDGVTELLSDRPCVCDPDNRECDLHTRLSVMLPNLPGLGVWRLETKGYYAARELAGARDVCQTLTARGYMLPARLRAEPREAKRQVDGKTTTFKYVVPVLDTPDVPLADLAALAQPARADPETGEITAGWKPVSAAALPAGRPDSGIPSRDSGVVPTPTIEEQMARVDRPRDHSERKNAQQPLPPTGLKPRAQVEGEGSRPSAEETAAASAVPPSPSSFADPQQVAIACREAGLDDEGRHAFLEAFSERRYDSAKEVPADEIAALRAALIRYKRSEIIVSPYGQLVDAKTGDPDTSPASPATLVPSALRTTVVNPEWDQGRWLKEIEGVQGVGVVKLLNKARALADDLDVDIPASLNEVRSPALIDELRAWIDEQRS